MTDDQRQADYQANVKERRRADRLQAAATVVTLLSLASLVFLAVVGAVALARVVF